ncbi:MAG: hypothetical protein AAGD13_04655 [Pseudomonadota bacterium]
MNMLISELQMLAGDWRSWIVVVLMALIAVHSAVYYVVCPYVHGRANISDAEVTEARGNPFKPGMRLGLMMVVGIVLTLTGLFMIADGVKPTLALAAMVVGIVIIQTEPTRSSIRESTQRVVALRDAEVVTREAAQSRLRGNHRELVTKNVVLLGALIAGMAVFG